MEIQGYKKRAKYLRSQKNNFSYENIRNNLTPTQFYTDTKKYSQFQSKRTYSHKQRDFFVNSYKYEPGALKKIINAKNLKMKGKFSFNRNQTPTFMNSLNISNKIEIAKMISYKNSSKIEEIGQRLLKLMDLYGVASLYFE